MSFEQELASWKIVAFEGPRSRKGSIERERVSRTRIRRIEKEKLRIQLSQIFDGSIRKQEWQAFISDSEGLIGSIEPPSKFRVLSKEISDKKVVTNIEEGGPTSINHSGTLSEGIDCHGACKNTIDAPWNAETYVNMFRTQYFKRKQIRARLLEAEGFVAEAQRIPSFSF